jgi:hypothetical protein
MRSLIAIAIGLLLLVSAAAATGNKLDSDVTVSAETSGMSITDAIVA